MVILICSDIGRNSLEFNSEPEKLIVSKKSNKVERRDETKFTIEILMEVEILLESDGQK